MLACAHAFKPVCIVDGRLSPSGNHSPALPPSPPPNAKAPSLPTASSTAGDDDCESSLRTGSGAGSPLLGAPRRFQKFWFDADSSVHARDL